MEQSGDFIPIFTVGNKTSVATTNLIGEYECRLDEKGRVIFPSALKKQLSQEYQEKFVINRGFEGCLVIYPMDVWNEISSSVNSLNDFVEENRRFKREFNNGANILVLDSQNRFVVPKILTPHAANHGGDSSKPSRPGNDRWHPSRDRPSPRRELRRSRLMTSA